MLVCVKITHGNTHFFTEGLFLRASEKQNIAGILTALAAFISG